MHDAGYSTGALDEADFILLYNISNLPGDTIQWGQGVNPFYARLHSWGSVVVFGGRQLIIQIANDISRTIKELPLLLQLRANEKR